MFDHQAPLTRALVAVIADRATSKAWRSAVDRSTRGGGGSSELAIFRMYDFCVFMFRILKVPSLQNAPHFLIFAVIKNKFANYRCHKRCVAMRDTHSESIQFNFHAKPNNLKIDDFLLWGKFRLQICFPGYFAPRHFAVCLRSGGRR